MRLPEAGERPVNDSDNGALVAPTSVLDNSLSALISLVFHLLLMLILAWITYDVGPPELQGQGQDVAIGSEPEKLGKNRDEELESVSESPNNDENELDDLTDLTSPTDPIDDPMGESALVLTPSAGDDPGDVMIGGPSGDPLGDGDWPSQIRQLRAHGLDIVIAFDSTGSMGGEIDTVKSKIKSIGTTLKTMIPKARISLCTYRDRGDDYVVKGLPLTGDIQKVDEYLKDIRAGGGGDAPEAVHEGLRWSVESNAFRPRARKVILLFGDQPPHREHLQLCCEIAGDFNKRQQGVVSTVTCRNSRPMRDFIDIAEAGGGEAFLTRDDREIMTKLMILVFGSRYRDKVVEAFKLMEG